MDFIEYFTFNAKQEQKCKRMKQTEMSTTEYENMSREDEKGISFQARECAFKKLGYFDLLAFEFLKRIIFHVNLCARQISSTT